MSPTSDVGSQSGLAVWGGGAMEDQEMRLHPLKKLLGVLMA
jgi:hypothetical protein